MTFVYCMNFGGPKDCFGHLHNISFNLYNGEEWAYFGTSIDEFDFDEDEEDDD